MKFDLHVHSKYSSDSKSSIENIIKRATDADLQGVSIVDHNSMKGSEEALNINPQNLMIIPGAEYSTDQGHFLVYFLKEGLEKQNLSRDSIGRFKWQDIISAAHEQQALAFLAHPYKQKKQFDIEIWNHLDGIEVYNSRASLSRQINANAIAIETAVAQNLAFSAGSDAHWLGEIGHAFWEYVPSETLIANGQKDISQNDLLKDIKTALKDRKGRIWGSATSRFYEPASQILKSFNTSSYHKAAKPLLKMAYSCILEGARVSGLGTKALEGWIDTKDNQL